jgi:EAL domain-containing protein (putative c-di-GMP-specific phosphodiesterase class I)
MRRGDVDFESCRRSADALQRREWLPWFQPQVEFGNGKVIGVEALARWERPRWRPGASAGCSCRCWSRVGLANAS